MKNLEKLTIEVRDAGEDKTPSVRIEFTFPSHLLDGTPWPEDCRRRVEIYAKPAEWSGLLVRGVSFQDYQRTLHYMAEVLTIAHLPEQVYCPTKLGPVKSERWSISLALPVRAAEALNKIICARAESRNYESYEVSSGLRRLWAEEFGQGKGTAVWEFTSPETEQKFRHVQEVYTKSPATEAAKSFKRCCEHLEQMALNHTWARGETSYVRIGYDWSGFGVSTAAIGAMGLIHHTSELPQETLDSLSEDELLHYGEWSLHS